MRKHHLIYAMLGLILLSSCSVQRGGNLVEKIRNGYYPYKVKRYVRPGYTEYGTASWYGRQFHGKRTADGEIYDMYAMTAAHKTLPFNTYVKVTNLNNHREAVVRINDRGPFVGDRIIDLSYTAAKKLGMIGTGTAPVKITVLSGNASIQQQNSINADINTGIANDAKGSADMQTQTPTSVYYIQIGSFRQLPNAIRFRDKASELISDVHIIKVIISNEVFYRVVIGSFATKDAAFDYADKEVAGRFKDFCVIGK